MFVFCLHFPVVKATVLSYVDVKKTSSRTVHPYLHCYACYDHATCVYGVGVKMHHGNLLIVLNRVRENSWM